MMANTSSFGLYLSATLLVMSGANHSLALTNSAAENIPHAAHPQETCKEDRLELAIQTMMKTMEDGLARAARVMGEIKEEVALLQEEMQSSKQAIESLENKLSNAVDTITSSMTDIVNNNATLCPTEPDPTPSALTTPSPAPITPSAITTPSPRPPSRNCHDLLQRGHSSSGVYTVTTSAENVKVYCDMTTNGGGWTVIQRRDDIEPHVDFERDWADYKRGFGDLEGEFWLGLDAIHGLTSDPSTPMRLRVELEDWEGEQRVALYHTFVVGGEGDKYRLTVGGYQKGPGGGGDPGDSLAPHNGWVFSTRDRDNDGSTGSNYAEVYKGGWWYYNSHYSNLNGAYLKGNTGQSNQGVDWYHWKRGKYSLRRAAMKIRPR